MNDTPYLDSIRVARPCTAAWSAMKGSDRVRHCSLCDLSVYNLSELTRDDAEAFLARRAGQRTCARFYRRPDGTVINRQCDPGWYERSRIGKQVFVALAALVTIVAGLDAAGAGPVQGAARGALLGLDAAFPGLGKAVVRSPLLYPLFHTADAGEIDNVDQNL